MKTNKKVLAGAMAILLATGGFVSKAHAKEAIRGVEGSANFLKNESQFDYFKRVISTDDQLSNEEKKYFLERLEAVKNKGNQAVSQVYGDYNAYIEQKIIEERQKSEKAAKKASKDDVNNANNKDRSKQTSKPKKKDNLEELKTAREEAKTAIKAVALLKELSPEKIKNVEAKLNALVVKAEALIKKADEKLAKAKVAFIATAYADDAEDDTDALIKELDSTTSEIKDLIKDKPEEKQEEEKKPEEKKEEKTPSKKAGNNAKTGVAGVAGLAGILAAASVAYAASKRD